MTEFLPGICWLQFYTKNAQQSGAVINAKFKMIRMFFNLCDLEYVQNPDQAYIHHCFATMPNPYHAWTYEGKPDPNTTTEPMKAGFDFCKVNGWLPIVCMGYQEELPHNWLGRAPKKEYWDWLGKFAKEFAIYLHNVYGFDRADLEVYNEPTKLQALGFGWNSYCELALIMANGWKNVPNYKVHVFADDLLRQEYLDNILTNTALMRRVDYISTHIGVGSEDEEWDSNLIQLVNDKIKKYPNLSQAVTELSFNGIWTRLSQLTGKVAMYGIIGAIRNKDFGTATRIDDLWLYGNDGSFEVTSPGKVAIITSYNKSFYKPYETEVDMIEVNYVKPGSNNEETRTVQQILSDGGYVCTVTGKYDTNTGLAIKEFQTAVGLKADGIVGRATWDKLINLTGTGTERSLAYLFRTARYL